MCTCFFFLIDTQDVHLNLRVDFTIICIDQWIKLSLTHYTGFMVHTIALEIVWNSLIIFTSRQVKFMRGYIYTETFILLHAFHTDFPDGVFYLLLS